MTPDPEAISWLRITVACIVVGGLLAILGLVMKVVNERSLGAIERFNKGKAGRRLRILETLPLDVRRRLVIVQNGDQEHLLLLGANEDIVVATSAAAQPAASPPDSSKHAP